MSEYIEKLRNRYIVNQEHHALRVDNPVSDRALARQWKAEGLTDLQRSVERLRYMLENEKPVVWPDEKIGMIRTLEHVPEIFTEEEFAEIKSGHYIHEQGKVCNINPDYMQLISRGFDEERKIIRKSLAGFEKAGNQAAADFEKAELETLDIIQAFAERYRQAAVAAGNTIEAESFAVIPAHKPETFIQALQFQRLIHYCLWCSFNYHNTLGRFDQYMYPFYKHDLDAGLLTKESALELLEEYFISFNKDSDLYTGMQQGDNGQSMVLGGLNPDGTESYNDLSDLCMEASLHLHLIDPKINLRVNKKTPLELYEKGTQMTKQGLGFPQYANDDVVIEAMKRWGYDVRDAYNYVVAACWEFIIPGTAMDVPNINGLSFAQAVVDILPDLKNMASFEDVMKAMRAAIFRQAQGIMDSVKNLYMEPAPLMSMVMDGCVERGKDISLGGKYNNYGIHGTGLSTAADSLAAIRKYIYDEKSLTADELNQALAQDWKGYDTLWTKLRYEAPKMGNNDDYVDQLGDELLNDFADALEGHHNDRGGIFRPGTGSAMYYIWHSKNMQATPDGRKAGEAIACNFSPSLFSRCEGPISIIKSFSKGNLVRVANGGPLTIEVHDTAFRNPDSIRKVAMFVKSYMDMGGHQMQINAVNRDELLDAKKHPENYRNLIVRVWGWSGYFVELDECYQDHIIKRMELAV